jgi:hypothetical protein
MEYPFNAQTPAGPRTKQNGETNSSTTKASRPEKDTVVGRKGPLITRNNRKSTSWERHENIMVQQQSTTV